MTCWRRLRDGHEADLWQQLRPRPGRLRVDEHGPEVAERREQDREADRQDEEECARHHR
jgi:hypothetical protein